MNIKEKLTTGIVSGALILNTVAPMAFADTNLRISGNGRNSENRIEYRSTSSHRISQTNDADIRNSVEIDSNTGGNSSSDNRRNSDIRTGRIDTHVEVNNHANSNHLSYSHNDGGSNGDNGNGNGNGSGGNDDISRLKTALSGDQEVPGPGDPDGKGKAKIRINMDEDELCSILKVRRIDPPTAAHIHKAPVGQAGPIVITLPTPSDGSSEGCVDVDEALLMDIKENPEEYYVNVHNAAYPDGAVRGQL